VFLGAPTQKWWRSPLSTQKGCFFEAPQIFKKPARVPPLWEWWPTFWEPPKGLFKGDKLGNFLKKGDKIPQVSKGVLG